MKTRILFISGAIVVCALSMVAVPGAAAAGEAMTGLKVLQPVRSFVVSPHEDWANLTGFGSQSDYVKMMTLMMVSGSGITGMKGMDMSPREASGSTGMTASGQVDMCNVLVKPVKAKPVVGANPLTLRVTDGAGKPLTGMKMVATVKMAAMDMGVAHPEVKERAPGEYILVPTFSMKGNWDVSLKGTANGMTMLQRTYTFDAGSTQAWVQPVTDVVFTAVAQRPLRVGDNTLLIKLTTPEGKPLDDVNAEGTVSMLTMNMGTSTVSAVKGPSAQLTLTVNLAMTGKWSVLLRALRNGKVVATRSVILSVP